jgi:tetratricopeptide (TPR) repeat protein
MGALLAQDPQAQPPQDDAAEGAQQQGTQPQPSQQAGETAQGQQPQKKVKDQGEYDLFNAVLKESDPNKKLELLNTWKQKYPDSDFKDDRLVYMIQAYAQTGKYPNAIASAKELLGMDPKNITAMFYINTLTPAAYPENAPADALDTAEKAAQGLLNAERPATAKPEEWQKAKTDLEATAHKTLGWVAWQRKNYDVAEQEFSKSLQINPRQGEVSYWRGSALLATRQPEKQAAGLYDIARAVVLPANQGGLPDEVRKKLDAYLTKTYVAYHGSEEGLGQIKQLAATQPLAPAGFDIKSKAELELAQAEMEKKTNPSLALWKTLKNELTGANGQQFFEANMKGAKVPGGAEGVQRFRGTLVSARPAARPTELVVAVTDPSTPEVTLKLDKALAGKPVPGSEVEFEGVPETFSKEPFMVTFEQASVTGLKMEATPTKRAPSKKANRQKR